MSNENNKMQVDIENLFKQNVNDLSAIKELYRKINEVEEKFLQIKYIDSTLANKLKKEYEKLKKIILDENVQAKLADDIETINIQLDIINSQLDKINSQLVTNNSQLETINSQLNIKANKNEVFTMANMGQDVKEAMTGGSVAVVGRNSVLAENIVEKQVTTDKLEFSSYTGKTKNLFNKNNGEIKRGFSMYGSGDENADETKFISHYIPISTTMGTYVRCGAIVEPLVQYTMQFYDNNKERIGNGYGNVLIPDNTAYMRFAGDLANIEKIVVNIDTTLTNYYDYSYINANDFYINNKKIVDTLKEYDIKIDNIASGEIYTKNINCYGDSLTYGEPISSVISYPKKLSNLLPDYSIKNYGVPSFITEQIMGYIGCGNFIVKPFKMPTAPYSAGKVKIEIEDNIYPILESATLWDLFNPVTIDGIEGKLTRVGKEIYFYFDESSPNYNSENLGHIVKYPTVLKSKISENKNSINIVFMGQNDLNLSDDELISKYRNVARKITSKYLFLGLTTGDLTTRKTLENKMKNEFGRKYINLRQYMCDYGLNDEGLTATKQDTEFIAQGKVPPQLLQSDLVHGKQSYYNIIANQVYLRGKEMGYW